jgi:hypothetical protein
MRKAMAFVAGSLLALGGVAVASPAQAHESGQGDRQSASVKYDKNHYKHGKSPKGNKWHDNRYGWWYGAWWQDNDAWEQYLSDWHQKWHDEHDESETPDDGGSVETPGDGGAVKNS